VTRSPVKRLAAYLGQGIAEESIKLSRDGCDPKAILEARHQVADLRDQGSTLHICAKVSLDILVVHLHVADQLGMQ
jgi:hypothetical protein